MCDAARDAFRRGRTLTPQAKDLALLRTLPLFSSLSEQTFNKLAESIRFDRYVKGDTIVRQGDKANWVMVVLEGFVKLTRLSPNGEETLIHIFGRGETFAESVAVLGDTHTTTAEAAGPTRIVRLPAHVVAQAAREAPELALAILHESSAKIWALMDEIEALKAQTADQRVLRFLLSLVAAAREERGGAPALHQGRHRGLARPEAGDAVALVRAAQEHGRRDRRPHRADRRRRQARRRDRAAEPDRVATRRYVFFGGFSDFFGTLPGHCTM